MRSLAMKRRGDTIGWWGCLKCGSPVNNDHSGPCLACGGHIGRMVPKETPLNADIGVSMLRDVVPEARPPQHHHVNLTAVSAAVVLCFASPLLGAQNEGWTALGLAMALNIWAMSVGCYALVHVRAQDKQEHPHGAAAHA